MKCLTIHILFSLRPSLALDPILRECRDHGRYPEIDFSEEGEKEKFANLNFFTEDLPTLWSSIRDNVLAASEDLRSCCMVVCEGEQGWDDHLILYHYDPSEPVSSI